MTKIGKCVVTGSQGQLGAELCRQVGAEVSAGWTQAGSDIASEPGRAAPESACVASEPGRAAPVVGLDLPEFDLTDRDRVVSTMMEIRPEVVVNTAAFTLVDKAEQEPALCRRVNVDGVRHLVEACRRLDCTLVQISTDYVFGRDACRNTPYRETDEPSPLSVYGQSKLEAEPLVARWPKHFIVRTCGLYGRLGPRSAGNFVETMLRLGATGGPLRVVNDQRCTPSYVPHVARAIRFLAGTTAYGTYHVVNTGETTWYEFAKELYRRAGSAVQVDPITTAEYGALAPRPAYSVLDTGKYHALAGCAAMPSWKDALAEYLAARL
jgi:dTDP-4-dehydrorhamnose reductase